MRVTPISPERLDPLRTPLQSHLWATVKGNLGDPPRAFRLEDGQPLLALLRKTPSGSCFAYIPWPEYGEVEPERRGGLLEETAESMAAFLPHDCRFIRFDLPWHTPYEAGENSEAFDTADGRPPQRLRELRMNFGTSRKRLRKAPTDVQPADTILLDITKDSDTLLDEMKSKTRYNIRLSGRRGVEVTEEGVDQLPLWYELYKETAGRRNITLHDYRNFEELLLQGSTRREYYRTKVHLLVARPPGGGTPLAGMILLRIGEYAMYLYGASGLRGRELMPNYRLQWEAIRLAASCGCSTYDLFGLPPTSQRSHPMHGLYRFKRGFGGSMVHLQGCWDYPLDPETYERIAGRELTGPSYHLR